MPISMGTCQVNSRPLELSRSEYIDLAAERRNDPAYAGRHIRLMMLLDTGNHDILYRRRRAGL